MELYSRKSKKEFISYNSIEEIKKIMKEEDITLFQAIENYKNNDKYNQDNILLSKYKLNDLLFQKFYCIKNHLSDSKIIEIIKKILNIEKISIEKISKMDSIDGSEYIINNNFKLLITSSKTTVDYLYDFQLTLIEQ